MKFELFFLPGLEHIQSEGSWKIVMRGELESQSNRTGIKVWKFWNVTSMH
jgi:hypothetical protein